MVAIDLFIYLQFCLLCNVQVPKGKSYEMRAVVSPHVTSVWSCDDVSEALSTSAEKSRGGCGEGGFLMRHLQFCSNEALFSEWPLKAQASIVKTKKKKRKENCAPLSSL